MSQITNFKKSRSVSAIVTAAEWTDAHRNARSGAEVAAFLRQHRRPLVVTGAGCSTESGLPDYRGPSGVWRHRQPMTISDFLRSEENRRYYWARGFSGWRRFALAAANAAHEALALLESHRLIDAVVTQNVDGLHQRAGSRSVVELHGSLHHVRCLSCNGRYSREEIQSKMSTANPDWLSRAAEIRADADAEVERAETVRFTAPRCDSCGGVLKPDVVFYGESIPAAVVTAASDAVAACDAVLVVGTSLSTFSSFRLVRDAAASGREVLILNEGVTRADDRATTKVDGRCGPVLRECVRILIR